MRPTGRRMIAAEKTVCLPHLAREGCHAAQRRERGTRWMRTSWFLQEGTGRSGEQVQRRLL